jgi:DNA-directed RNA polymerase specialized sigma24 family protein
VRAVLRNPDKAKHWFNLGCQVDIAEMEDAAPFIESDLDADSDIASGPEWLSRALLQLPFRQRAVIELSYGIGLSCDEICSVMQCTMKMVKIRLLQARRHLDRARGKMPRG